MNGLNFDGKRSSDFTYQSLDPQTPTEIEEYSDLYDDYMLSPQSDHLESMNSGAAVYDQSVGPSVDDLRRPSSLNNGRLGSDESLDSSFAGTQPDISLQTPKLDYSNNFGSTSPETLNGQTRTPIFKRPVDNILQDHVGKSPKTPAHKGNNFNTTPTIKYESTDEEDENDNVSGKKYYNTSSTPNYDNTIDLNDDDDYDDDEVEKLRLLSKKKSQHLYSTQTSSNGSYGDKSNDAIIIKKVEGQPDQVIKKGIKDFKIGRELGEGSYSTVMLATDLTTHRNYALKILNKRHIIKEKKVRYVNIEKDALNRLGDHNGIVRLHYTFQDSQSLYFVLDFAENGELLTMIKKHGTMNEHCAKHYNVQLVDTIDYMHNNGIIHRDLKPENILIDKDLRLQITDFGTAKILDKDDSGNYPPDARAQSFVGTAEYVSPELLSEKYCGKAADVWAFGCIVYQMIAGKPPFKANNEYQTFQKIQKLQYAFTAGFPIIIRDLVKRVLILKPRERLTIPDIKRHMWFQDIDWNNEDQIWNTIPPELGPYKLSAKAMKPMPELNNQYPNGSSTSIHQPKKSKSGNVLLSNSRKVSSSSARQCSASANLAPTSAPTSNNGLGISTSSPNVISSSPNRNGSVGSTKKAKPKKKSASSAAVAALYGNQRQSSHGSATPASEHIPATPPVRTLASTHTPSSTPPALSKAGGHQTVYKVSESQHQTADLIVRSRQTIQPKERVYSSGSSVDVIPGTNIPRPVLNTKITSRTTTASRSRNNSSFKTAKPAEIPPMSKLDLKWVQFLKHPDERIVKVGIVESQKESTIQFEKKYKGLIIESPLGYVNKDNINMSNLFSSSDAESIMVFDKQDLNNEEVVEDQAEEPEATSSVDKFRKFFTVKQPALSHQEPLFHTRTLLITTFGRALLFAENLGVDKKLKYEITLEADLTNELVHFVEVVDRKLNSDEGLFAIMSDSMTICFKVEKQEVTQWTQSLANSRLLEKERKLRSYLLSHSELSRSNEDSAHAAATLAANMSPEIGASSNKSYNPKSKNKTAFPSTLRPPDSETHGSTHPPSTKVHRKKAPPPPPLQAASKTSNELPPSRSKKKSIGKGPMISAAISKAVSMASVNAAVGVKDKDENKKVNTSNSKFLARSRIR